MPISLASISILELQVSIITRRFAHQASVDAIQALLEVAMLPWLEYLCTIIDEVALPEKEKE